MTREEAQAQEISRQVEALLSGQQDAGAAPLLDTARLLAESAPAAPSPVFAQQLRRRLLQAGSALADLAQERRPRMWKRFAAVSMAAMVILALVGVLWPHSPSAEQVLARAAESTAVQPGQIGYQVYTSEGNLYRVWQRFELAAEDDLMSVPVERMMIRYAKDDLTFQQPLEWNYSGPTRFCRLTVTGEQDPAADAEGCRTAAPVANPSSAEPGYTEAMDPTLRQRIAEELRDAPDAPDTSALETIQVQIEQLQSSADAVSITPLELENGRVYAITGSQDVPSADAETVTYTLYVDANTFVPMGLRYLMKESSGKSATWEAMVLDYRIFDAGELEFDPFAWPPAGSP